MFNPYEVLGVSIKTPKEEIKRKYRKLCAMYHPDNGGNAEKFDEVNKAWTMIDSGKMDLGSMLPKRGKVVHNTIFTFAME